MLRLFVRARLHLGRVLLPHQWRQGSLQAGRQPQARSRLRSTSKSLRNPPFRFPLFPTGLPLLRKKDILVTRHLAAIHNQQQTLDRKSATGGTKTLRNLVTPLDHPCSLDRLLLPFSLRILFALSVSLLSSSAQRDSRRRIKAVMPNPFFRVLIGSSRIFHLSVLSPWNILLSHPIPQVPYSPA